MEKSKTSNLSVEVTINNTKELQELIDRAVTLTKQLQETLEQISEFKCDITVNNSVDNLADKLYEAISQSVTDL